MCHRVQASVYCDRRHHVTMVIPLMSLEQMPRRSVDGRSLQIAPRSAGSRRCGCNRRRAGRAPCRSTFDAVQKPLNIHLLHARCYPGCSRIDFSGGFTRFTIVLTRRRAYYGVPVCAHRFIH